MVTRYIGREPLFRGKTLYELVCNLRDFGEGRVVYRQIYRRFPETSYYRLTKVEPDMSDETRQGGTAWGRKVYRGRQFDVCKINAGYKTDWMLVPKEEEQEFCRITKVLPEREKPPSHFDCPPLLELLTRSELTKTSQSLGSQQLQLDLNSAYHTKPQKV